MDPKYKEVKLAATLDAKGYEKGLWLYRMTLTASTPLPRAGTIALGGRITNGRGMTIVTIPDAQIPFPADERERRGELCVRLALQFAEPDPLRGGIVCGLQVFDADGKPAGEPAVGKARPGSAEVEFWPLAAEARGEWTLSLKGDKALPLAAIHEARLLAEGPAGH
jgi:hypothetical protein